ncbi:MAG TPA: transposase [Pyrinomonadaceae bacterium]
MKFFETIAGHVHIRQKAIKHTPPEKLQDAFIAILAGAHGLVEVKTRVRSDEALQRACGRSSCAEQSVVQETLDACTGENVRQMEEAVAAIFRAHSRAYRHDYQAELLLLDVDLTGLPCGRSGESAAVGYLSGYGVRRGRQLGRVVAPVHDEVVADRLYPGHLQLRDTLPHLVEALEWTLELDEAKRRRTVPRIDAGGGSLNGINWLLKRGSHVHCKDISTKRAAHYALSVREWVSDPRRKGRELGWALVKSGDYARPVRRLALRWRKRNGQRCHALLISTLAPREVLKLLGEPEERVRDEPAVMTAYARLYDERGGGVEIEIKESKQGLGVTQRRKKSYTGQQMVMLLGTLAHNVVVWAKRWLAEDAPKLKRYGVQRVVRDVLAVSGFVELSKSGAVRRVVLNGASAVGRACAKALRLLLEAEHVRVTLGET